MRHERLAICPQIFQCVPAAGTRSPYFPSTAFQSCFAPLFVDVIMHSSPIIHTKPLDNNVRECNHVTLCRECQCGTRDTIYQCHSREKISHRQRENNLRRDWCNNLGGRSTSCLNPLKQQLSHVQSHPAAAKTVVAIPS